MAKESGDKEILQQMPGGVGRFFVVIRRTHRDAFRVAYCAIAYCCNENTLAGDEAPEAGFKGLFEWDLQDAEFDLFNVHSGFVSGDE